MKMLLRSLDSLVHVVEDVRGHVMQATCGTWFPESPDRAALTERPATCLWCTAGKRRRHA